MSIMRDEQEEAFKVDLALKKAWGTDLCSINGVIGSLLTRSLISIPLLFMVD